MQIVTCKPYHAVSSGRGTIEMPDGKSVFKVYYLSIVGRDKPELYEWERCAFTQEAFERRFLGGAHEGVGFVTAFPHITKIFRFAPAAETLLEVQAFDTCSMESRDCTRDEGYYEFACYAEAVIAGEEYRAWAASRTVVDYLAFVCPAVDYPVTTSGKLREYWRS